MFTQLLSFWVTGALLLALSCDVVSASEEDDDDVTPTPDYDYENITFDYYLYNTSSPSINYDDFEELGSQGNKDSCNTLVPIFRHYLILFGLLVIHVCQQT